MTRPVSSSLQMTSGAMLVALAAVWGGSFFFAEIALRELPPLTITLHRVFWAVPVLLAVVLGKAIKVPRSARVWLAYLVMGALNNAIPFSLIFWGQTNIESGLASILNSTTAVFGAVVAGLLLADEPLTARKVAGAGLGVLGVAVIMGREALMTLDPRSLSQLAVIGAALSYSLASVWARRMLSGQPPIMNALGMLVGSTVLMLPVAVAVDGPPALALQATTWGALVALSVMSTALAYLLYFAILARAGAANLLLVTLLIPPFAIGLGAVFLGERLGAEVWPGALCIALGLAVTDGRPLRWLTGKRRRAPQ
ncbi:DMT family transporter [Defluviimonas sp. D31]|uniref:DMT family transporter n=1 Tax=Defluviimonas sp. D31 TaxID=3083253 RepID=UPI00296F4E61|nr:DMT family transporter [Defluviimonas sp. D31]MDW4551417.1 DMT family transporter [Defluviimonas sp. D31]